MENLCRTCLRYVVKVSQLNEDLIRKIEVISSLKLQLDEVLPLGICDECKTNVQKFYNFRKVLINSNKDLQERCEVLKLRKDISKTSEPINNSIKKCTDNINVDTSRDKANNDNDSLDNNLLIKNEKSEAESDVKSEHSYIQLNTDNVNFEITGEIIESGNESCDNDNYTDNLSNTGDENCIKKEQMSDIERALALMRVFQCKICDQTFTSRFKLINHRRTEHYAKSVCSICGAITRSDNIRKHIQMHSETPVECKVCGRVCKNTESLRAHMLIHRGEIYTCEICGRVSRIKAEHKRHMKSHSDPEIGKQMCNLCGKKVRVLKRHMLSHTGERPHICVHCGKGFTSPYALKVHTRQHTNEKPYMCDYCSLAFPQKVSLVMHIKSKHQSKSEFG